jgi:AAA15 family ATPase/GTPase
MKIEEISIKNVKSFRDKVTLKFNSRFNILIGPNAGGKSNLLDILTVVTHHFFIKGYSINHGNEQGITFKDINQQQSFRQIDKVLEKFIDDQSDSEIEIVYKLTKGDIDNLKSIKKNKDLLENTLIHNYRNKPIPNLDFCNSWDFRRIKENQQIKYRIINNR